MVVKPLTKLRKTRAFLLFLFLWLRLINHSSLDHWVCFVNRSDWKPIKNSVICEKHFESKYILIGKQRNLLDWKLNPIPTLHTDMALKKPSLLPTLSVPRKTPKLRVYQEDELCEFNSMYAIRSFEELCKKDCLTGFSRMMHQDAIVFYNVVFNEAMMPKMFECIKVSKEMHVALEYKGNPVPLSTWFVRGHDARLDNIDNLDNSKNICEIVILLMNIPTSPS